MNAIPQHGEPASASECRAYGWKRQFMRPDGAIGKLFGRLMASKNAAQTLTGIDMFDVQPTDHVLEIGFGPGVGIEALTTKAVDGRICGVDWSSAMLELASKRNRAAIESGRVVLRQGSAEQVPFPDRQFDKVFEANSFHIWPDQDAALREIHRVLKPGGEFMLCLRMQHPTRSKFVAPGHKDEDIPAIQARLERAGFEIVRMEPVKLKRTITYLTARSPL